MTKKYKYGDKRDYRPIQIFRHGKYLCTTTWSRTCKEALEQFFKTELLSCDSKEYYRAYFKAEGK